MVSYVSKGIASVVIGLAAALQLFELMDNSAPLLRPPGADDEKTFLSKCIRCGKCALACPYEVIRLGGCDDGVNGGTPHLKPRAGACRLCNGFPCTTVCPTGALEPITNKHDVRMGLAIIDRDLCVALKGIRCEVCYRVCPLIDEAITIKYALREGDDRHAIFEPVINSDVCTGCGICEERCVIDSPAVAIRVKPQELWDRF